MQYLTQKTTSNDSNIEMMYTYSYHGNSKLIYNTYALYILAFYNYLFHIAEISSTKIYNLIEYSVPKLIHFQSLRSSIKTNNSNNSSLSSLNKTPEGL